MLNQTLSAQELAAAYAVHRRLLITDVLAPAEADKLYECLHARTPWKLVFREDEQSKTLGPEGLEQMPPLEKAALTQRIYRQAATQFQFLYDSCPGPDIDPSSDVHRLLEYVKGEEFMRFARTVTDEPDLKTARGHAVRYRAGHFLTKHDDSYGHESRRVAYVFNFSRDWHSGWGGLLHFLDDRDRVVQTLVPGFNTLVLFTVPAQHSVSIVAPFALRNRYSVTGWFHV